MEANSFPHGSFVLEYADSSNQHVRGKMRLLSGKKLFFGQQILSAENVMKGPAQYKLVPPTGITYLLLLKILYKFTKRWLVTLLASS